MRHRRKRHYGKVLVAIVILTILPLLDTKIAKAGDTYPENIDYGEIQDVIDDILNQDNGMDFGSYVEDLVNGEAAFSLTDIGEQLIEAIRSEIKENVSTLARLITIAILAAIFANLSAAFKNNQVSETGFYVTYLLLFGLLLNSFITASKIASETIESILGFMKALVPAYFMSVGFCTGSASSFVFYEATLIVITVADFLLIRIVIPLINFYLIIALVNNISKEDMLSKLAGLLSTIIHWLLKSLLAGVVGINAIQGLIIPVADRVKKSALLKASESIPGVGNVIGGVTETILGAGYLLKNAIGVAGLVVIIIICAVPLIKLIAVTFIYRCSTAALQPISDKRIMECVTASAKSSGLLLQTVFVGAVLFMLTITIVAVTTGGIT